MKSAVSASEHKYFGPLTLHQKCEIPSIFKNEESFECSCILCEEKFLLPISEKQLLTHLFMVHRLVIADVNQVADLNEYLRYWRLRFKDESLPYFCTTMLLDSKPDGTGSKDEKYYLLCDVLPEDKELRSNLQQNKLEKLMQRFQFERNDKNYERECLFCRFNSVGTRADYLNHLYEKHNFYIAKPDKLIFIDNLINVVASKLEKLQCIYCEGIFKDRNILKEHMRKKGHKRINPDKQEYDKYFLVNYDIEKKHVNTNKKPTYSSSKYKKYSSVKNDTNENNSDIDSDQEWSSWVDENGPLITCLLCDHTEVEYESILTHMENQHGFSFMNATQNMTFYHKVKIVNFIRRQVHLKQCLSCDTRFDDSKNLGKHLKEMKHWELEKARWDQPEYYFPTYEDDLFLVFIQDDDESWWSEDDREVDERNDMSDDISKAMAMSVLND